MKPGTIVATMPARSGGDILFASKLGDKERRKQQEKKNKKRNKKMLRSSNKPFGFDTI